ncbi:MAG: carbohydrate ABC transporter permease [Hungatella sp.]|nr:carbohydrate ABC transporter permease [Hungatella sp.]
MKNRWTKRLIFGIVVMLLLLIAVIELVPFVWMFMSGFKSNSELLLEPFKLPEKWLAGNYLRAWKNGIGKYLVNSVFVTVISTAMTLVLSIFAAYPIARMRYRFRKASLVFVMSGLMLAPMVAMIPLYKILINVHLYDTYWAMIFPYVAFRLPFTIFLIWSFFAGIPKDIEESAIIDGCSPLGVLWKIFVPLSKPIISTAGLLAVRTFWNELMFALCFTQSAKLKTVPVGLLSLKSSMETEWPVLVAGLALSTLPVVILYILFQKQLIRNITAGGVKG